MESDSESIEMDDYTHEGDDNYHDASNHGFAWAVINELLHIIVFVFTLFGMINFRVKFITVPQLVGFVKRCIVAFNAYLSAKFFLLASLMYFYNFMLERRSIEISNLNCTLIDYPRLLVTSRRNESMMTMTMANNTTGHLYAADSRRMLNVSLHSTFDDHHGEQQFSDLIFAHLTWAVDSIGGPYKLLGNMATLIYGVYAIAFYIMLAIFPFELYFVQVGFNFIRFVLSDSTCMRTFYERRQRHVEHLASWSRFEINSDQSQAIQVIVNQYNLRGGQPPSSSSQNLPFEFLSRRPQQRQQAELDSEQAESSTSIAVPQCGRILERARPGDSHRQGMEAATSSLCNRLSGFKVVADSEQSRAHSILAHMDRPSYPILTALRNVRKFKPFVRSENWFKASMIFYPMFIFFYFVLHLFATALIQVYLDSQLAKQLQACKLRHLADKHTHWNFESWSLVDYILYYEHIYSVPVLSIASSFYCSYYFSTILELVVWGWEVAQQLLVSARVIQLASSLEHNPPDVDLSPFEVRHELSSSVPSWIDFYVNDFGGFKEISPRSKAQESLKKSFKQPSKYKLLDMMALRLLTKKETLLRATYLNMCLFFDELEETRFIVETILRRLTQICAGFAFMASITQSQYKTSYWNLNILLFSTFVILNIYLVCAASLTNIMNKIFALTHSVIAALVSSGSESADMLDNWQRYVAAKAQEMDANAYTIYGYKVTWSAIISIDSVLFTAFFVYDTLMVKRIQQ